MTYDRPLLTQKQRDELDAQRIDMERHNVWRVLSNDGTNGWKYPCMCKSCNRDLPEPDIREGGPL